MNKKKWLNESETTHYYKSRIIIIRETMDYSYEISYSWAISNAMHTGISLNNEEEALERAKKVIDEQIKWGL